MGRPALAKDDETVSVTVRIPAAVKRTYLDATTDTLNLSDLMRAALIRGADDLRGVVGRARAVAPTDPPTTCPHPRPYDIRNGGLRRCKACGAVVP